MTDLPVADRWFVAEPADDGVTRLWEPHVDAFLVSNVWHVRGRDADLVVDTANGFGALRPAVTSLTGSSRPMIAVASHAHFDHVGGLHEFGDRRVHADDAAMTRSPFPLRIHRAHAPAGTAETFAYFGFDVPELMIDALPAPAFDTEAWVASGAEPTTLLRDGDVIDLGDRWFEVLHTPGHTAGSACLWEQASGILFTGDAVYVDARLRFDDPRAARRSLERLLELPVRVAHAGHERSFDRDELREVASAALAGIDAGEYDP